MTVEKNGQLAWTFEEKEEILNDLNHDVTYFFSMVTKYTHLYIKNCRNEKAFYYEKLRNKYNFLYKESVLIRDSFLEDILNG